MHGKWMLDLKLTLRQHDLTQILLEISTHPDHSSVLTKAEN